MPTNVPFRVPLSIASVLLLGVLFSYLTMSLIAKIVIAQKDVTLRKNLAEYAKTLNERTAEKVVREMSLHYSSWLCGLAAPRQSRWVMFVIVCTFANAIAFVFGAELSSYFKKSVAYYVMGEELQVILAPVGGFGVSIIAIATIIATLLTLLGVLLGAWGAAMVTTASRARLWGELAVVTLLIPCGILAAYYVCVSAIWPLGPEGVRLVTNLALPWSNGATFAFAGLIAIGTIVPLFVVWSLVASALLARAFPLGMHTALSRITHWLIKDETPIIRRIVTLCTGSVGFALTLWAGAHWLEGLFSQI